MKYKIIPLLDEHLNIEGTEICMSIKSTNNDCDNKIIISLQTFKE